VSPVTRLSLKLKI